MKYALIAGLALILTPAAVTAAGEGLPVDVKTAVGVSYYNGGVGLEERAAMPQIYPLKVVLATDKGRYLNDAEITVSDSGGEVFRVRADNGPWLVADLPPGTYTVTGVLEGLTASRKGVSISKGARRIVTLRWRESEVDMGL